METLSITCVLGALFCIASGVIAARFAHKAYGLVLGGMYTAQLLALLVMADGIFHIGFPTWIYALPLIGGLLVWAASRMNFLWLWGSMTSVGWTVLIAIGLMIDEPASMIGPKTMAIPLLGGLLAAIVLRKHGRVIIVGTATGLNVGSGLLLLAIAVLGLNEPRVLGYLAGLLPMIGVAGGLYYQYKIDRRLLLGTNAPTPA